MKIKIAAIQMNSQNDLKKNLLQAKALMEGAVRQLQPQLLVLPEVFPFIGEEKEMRGVATALRRNEPIKMCGEFARDHGVAILAGSVLLKAPGGRATNTSVFISSQGKIIRHYDKIHLFNYTAPNGEVYHESEHIKPGTDEVVFTEFGICFGLAICYDLRFPELFRRLGLLGAEVILLPSAFTKITGEAHWEVLVRARAIENQVFVVAANQTGHHYGQRDSFGASMIVDPWGRVVTRAGEEVGFIVAEIDTQVNKDLRNKMSCLTSIRYPIQKLKLP
jgi:nitrilase